MFRDHDGIGSSVEAGMSEGDRLLMFEFTDFVPIQQFAIPGLIDQRLRREKEPIFLSCGD